LVGNHNIAGPLTYGSQKKLVFLEKNAAASTTAHGW